MPDTDNVDDSPRKLRTSAQQVFIAFGSVGAIILAVLAVNGNLVHDVANGDTPLYLLSTAAQVVSALFGTTVALVFLAVQFSAQYFSPQGVIRVLTTDRLVGFCSGLHLLTIALSVFLIGNRGWSPIATESAMRVCLSAVVALTLVCLIVLPLTIARMLNVLSPSGFAQLIMRQWSAAQLASVSRATNLFAVGSPAGDAAFDDDPLFPIGDIILESIRRRHFAVANQVMDNLARHVNILLAKECLDQRQVDLIIVHICSHLERIVVGTPQADLQSIRLPLLTLVKGLLSKKNQGKLAHYHIRRLMRTLPEALRSFLTSFGVLYIAEAVRQDDVKAAAEVATLLISKGLIDHVWERLQPSSDADNSNEASDPWAQVRQIIRDTMKPPQPDEQQNMVR